MSLFAILNTIDFQEPQSITCLTKQEMMYGDMLENSPMPKEACLMIDLSGRFAFTSNLQILLFLVQSYDNHLVRLRHLSYCI